MGKVPEYKFLETAGLDMDTCPIQITSGEFAGIVYRYGKISLKEIDTGDVQVTMDISIVNGPENFNHNTPEFTMAAGEIFVDIVEKNAKVEDPADLEDDVHQD
jgi:hypothetical protein